MPLTDAARSDKYRSRALLAEDAKTQRHPMSRAEAIILAALNSGPLFFERRAGCGWYFPSPNLSHRFGERPRRRYFRTMDVRRVIASGRAIQVENQLVKARNPSPDREEIRAMTETPSNRPKTNSDNSLPNLPRELSRSHELLSEAFEKIAVHSAELGLRIACHLERIEAALKRIEETKQETQ